MSFFEPVHSSRTRSGITGHSARSVHTHHQSGICSHARPDRSQRSSYSARGWSFTGSKSTNTGGLRSTESTRNGLPSIDSTVTSPRTFPGKSKALTNGSRRVPPPGAGLSCTPRTG